MDGAVSPDTRLVRVLSDQTQRHIGGLEDQLLSLENELREAPKFASGMQRRLNSLLKEALSFYDISSNSQIFVYDGDVNARFARVVEQYVDIVRQHPKHLDPIDVVELFRDYAKEAFNALNMLKKGMPAEHLPKLLVELGYQTALNLPVPEPINELEGLEFPVEGSAKKPSEVLVLGESDFIMREVIDNTLLRQRLEENLYNHCAASGVAHFASSNGFSEQAMQDLRQRIRDAFGEDHKFTRLQLYLNADRDEIAYAVVPMDDLRWISAPITGKTLQSPILQGHIEKIIAECRKYFGQDHPLFGTGKDKEALQHVKGLLAHELSESPKRIIRFTIYEQQLQGSKHVSYKLEEIPPL